MQPQLRPWVQWAQDGAAAMQNMWLQGPTSRAISRTKNRAIPGAIRMVLHSLAAVLVWLKVAVVVAAVVFVSVQDRSC